MKGARHINLIAIHRSLDGESAVEKSGLDGFGLQADCKERKERSTAVDHRAMISVRDPVMIFLTHGTMRISTIGFMIAAASLGNAQWVNYPSSKTPMTRDGKPNLASKAPRMHGKPDLSGVWQIEPHPDEIERLFEGKVDKQAEGDDPRQFSKYIVDLLIDYKGQPSPARAEALAIKEKRRETMDSPSSHCLPLGVPAVELIGFPFKIIQAHDTVVIFYENGGVFRQVHVDGRKLPDAPFPSWLGYSSGR
jgi:hypothetical protein